MSRIFSKLRILPQQRDAENLQEPLTAAASSIRPFPVVLSIAAVAAIAAAFFLGILSSNIATIKNNIFLSMDANIQRQQNQIRNLNKELTALQLSTDKRIKNTEAATKNFNKDVQIKISDLNDRVNSKLDQAAINANHIEANLQANIDSLNAKITEINNGKDNAGPAESNAGKP